MDSTLLLMMAKFLLNDDLRGKSELFLGVGNILTIFPGYFEIQEGKKEKELNIHGKYIHIYKKGC